MKPFAIVPIILLTACHSTPAVEGFDSTQWEIPLQDCSDSKVQLGEILVNHQHQLLGSSQTEVKALLGKPDEHELYLRTQKFFYYNLTPGDTCTNISKPLRLSILFDALDRAKEVMIIE